MKKIAIAGLILIINMLSFFSYCEFQLRTHPLADENKKYAQIQKENVQFYFSSNGEVAFTLPITYYVELLADVDENGFYRAKYLKQIGFVKKDDIVCVSNFPNETFLSNVNFRILANQSAELRSEPSREKGLNTLICELELYETNFIFYGEKIGEEVVSKRGNIWYYCSHIKNGKEQFGYVYSGLVDQKSSFSLLEINNNIIEKHDWTIPEKDNQENANFTIETPNTSQLAIIVGISIPALLLILALFRPIRTGKTIKNKISKSTFNSSKLERKEKSNVITLSKNRKNTKPEKGKDFYELK